MEPVELTEDGLLLRPWRAADADAVHRACQDPDIQRWTTVPRPYLPDHARAFVGEISAGDWRAGTRAPFAVCDAATGELLASCGLVSVDQTTDTGEVGYWVAPWARGRGVATRATRALARWAFDALGLRRLIWQAEIGNHASRLAGTRWLAGEAADLAIVDAHTGELAGGCMLYHDEQATGQAMIGFSLLPAGRGRGLATRAVRLVTGWAFDGVGLARVWAGTRPENAASQRVLERAGFTREGLLRGRLPGPDGTRVDSVQYARLATDELR
ncbi:GNAT family N-acetyltransferase [Micromonospora sp. DH15]|nr:GNAT family N-acetyltransferase [Micromonospora sp. DH15]